MEWIGIASAFRTPESRTSLKELRNPGRDISFPIFTRKKLKQKELEKKSK